MLAFYPLDILVRCSTITPCSSFYFFLETMAAVKVNGTYEKWEYYDARDHASKDISVHGKGYSVFD